VTARQAGDARWISMGFFFTLVGSSPIWREPRLHRRVVRGLHLAGAHLALAGLAPPTSRRAFARAAGRCLRCVIVLAAAWAMSPGIPSPAWRPRRYARRRYRRPPPPVARAAREHVLAAPRRREERPRASSDR